MNSFQLFVYFIAFFHIFCAFFSFNFIYKFQRWRRRWKGLETVQKELKDDEALPKLLVFGIALIGLGLLIANTALVAWFIIRKRIKGKKNMKPIFSAFCLFARSTIYIFSLVLFNLFFFVVPMKTHVGSHCWTFVVQCFFFHSLEQFSLWLLFRHWF